MAITNITMNLTALRDITPPNISVDSTDVFNNVISNANSITDGMWIIAPMLIILIVVYYTLSDRSPLGDFGYSDVRALNLSLAVSIIIGLKIIGIGWSGNFYSVGMFGTGWLTTLIIILVYESKE